MLISNKYVINILECIILSSNMSHKATRLFILEQLKEPAFNENHSSFFHLSLNKYLSSIALLYSFIHTYLITVIIFSIIHSSLQLLLFFVWLFTSLTLPRKIGINRLSMVYQLEEDSQLHLILGKLPFHWDCSWDFSSCFQNQR